MIDLDNLILGKTIEQEENPIPENGRCFEVKGKYTFMWLSG